MNDQKTGDAAVPPPSPRRLVRTVAAFGAVALIVGGWFAWRAWFTERPPLPAVDLINAPPALATAITDAEAGVRSTPRSAKAWGKLGMVLMAHDYFPEACDCFSEAARYDQSAARWSYFAAQTCFKIYPLRAIALAEKAVAADSGDPVFRIFLGELLLEQGRLDDAEAHLVLAVRDETLRPWILIRLAQIEMRRGRIPDALEHAYRSLELMDDTKIVHMLLSEIHFRMGDGKAAEREYQQSISLPQRTWPDSHMNAVDRLKVTALPLLARAKQDADALEVIARDNPQSSPVRIQLAIALLAREEWPAAAAAAADALKLNPTDAVALNVLGIALRNQGRLADAVAAYKKSAAANPYNAVTHYELANCYHRLHQRPMAVDCLRTAVRLRPNYAIAWRELGQFLGQDGDADAEMCLRRAVELANDDESARKFLSEATMPLDKARPSVPK